MDPSVTDPKTPPVGDAEAPDLPLNPADAAGAAYAGVPAEPPEEAVRRLTGEQDQLQDRYARLAAEYDNFRKRVAREREELTARSQAVLANRLLDVLDDMERLLAGDRTTAPVDVLFQGMELVGKKLWKELEVAGLERLDPAGQAFDPAVHEAVATTPAPTPAQDHTVCRTFQAGYRFKGALLRPARVQVYADPGQA